MLKSRQTQASVKREQTSIRRYFDLNPAYSRFYQKEQNCQWIQWIQQVQGIWEITEAWIGFDLIILSVSCAFLEIKFRFLTGSNTAIFFQKKIFFSKFSENLRKNSIMLFT